MNPVLKPDHGTATRLAFAKYYKAEHTRDQAALSDITDLMFKHMGDDSAAIDAICERLERHWGRYGEPGSLAPLGDAIADAAAPEPPK